MSKLEFKSDIEKVYTERVLTKEAIDFIESLELNFRQKRMDILKNREVMQSKIDSTLKFDFLEETKNIRDGEWTIGEIPSDLIDRRVEITGPTDAKMVINAMNSGANVFMADFEDALSPTFKNVLHGQINMQEAARRTLEFSDGKKSYKLNKETLSVLFVRPRGLHLDEKNITIDGEPISGSLFDFGMHFFHNATKLIENGSGPYFYIPKMEHYLEARFWNEVFDFSEATLGLKKGTIKVTCLIETITAAFQMEEFLFELKDHIVGLNAGRWDYIFSTIKKFSNNKSLIFPDRGHITMSVPFMRAYSKLLVQSCHKRKAHAIGGMAAFIPSRKDEKINEIAFNKINEDKQNEAKLGFDGTWVAHPDLVEFVKKIFDNYVDENKNQKNVEISKEKITTEDLLNFKIEGSVTEDGIRKNINVTIQYINHWLNGTGAVALHNLMEDAATAEISRAQLWKSLQNKAIMADGREFTKDMYLKFLEEEVASLGGYNHSKNAVAVTLLNELVLSHSFNEFLTVPAYKLI